MAIEKGTTDLPRFKLAARVENVMNLAHVTLNHRSERVLLPLPPIVADEKHWTSEKLASSVGFSAIALTEAHLQQSAQLHDSSK